MIDESKQSIFHKILLVVLTVYIVTVVISLLKDKNNIVEKIKRSIIKTKATEYIFLLLSLSLLIGDYLLNDKLTKDEKRGLYHIIHLSIIVSLTALFAHLDLFVIPAMVAIGLWVISA